jgi:ABC-2 type transport system permease protein
LQAGRFDLAFVVVWLFPLLALMLSYNLLAAEREEGTLALLLSQPVSLWQIILGKALARAVIAIGGFGALALIGILIGLLTTGIQPFCPTIILGLCSWFLLVAGYGLFWLGLAAFVNLQRHSAARNIVTLAGAWLLLALVIPSLLSNAAALIYPMPPRAELIIAERDAEPDLARDGARALAAFRQAHPDLQPAAPTIELSDSRRQILATFLENNRAFEAVARRYDDQLTKQQWLLDRLGLLSPAVVMNESLSHLAGTGSARFRQFRAQVWQWALAQRAFFVPKIMRGEKLTTEDYDTLPHFSFQDESGVVVARRALIRLIGLLAPTVLTGVITLRALRRYTVAG